MIAVFLVAPASRSGAAAANPLGNVLDADGDRDREAEVGSAGGERNSDREPLGHVVDRQGAEQQKRA